MDQVDNSILEAAVSVLESDETRQLSKNCQKTSVDFDEFMERYKGTRHIPYYKHDKYFPKMHIYVYKNLVVYSFIYN